MAFGNFLLTLFSSISLMRSVLANAGRATWYDPAAVGMCGTRSAPWELFTALYSTDYGHGENCGRMIQINYQGRSIRVQVVDECITCHNPGDMDLSEAAFKTLAGDLGKGITPIQWEYV